MGIIKKYIDKIRFKKAMKKGDKKYLIEQYRKSGVKIGEHCNICSKLGGNEPYLIEIGNNVVISYNVDFVTHDASFCALSGRWYQDLYGKIIIGDNVFIGSGSTLMYGVTIGKNAIVASHSVVTKSVPEGYVVAGVPARIICKTEEFINKNKNQLIDTNGLSFDQKKDRVLNSNKLVKRENLKDK